MRDANGARVLVRSRHGRMVAGVCAGVAEYFGIDVTLVRVLVVVLAVITGGAGLLAYLAAWAIIPGERDQAWPADNIAGTTQHAGSGSGHGI